ncbi:(Fe-S)-binding protein [Desulfurella sp.]|uniref:(Fe-S)-binding protein n=1 Tax=Desulfurella sp. TaxID=1962857 RepID=UPI003D0A565A
MDERLKKEWESCVKCGLCRSVCPVFKELRQEPFVARGHISLLSEFIKGNFDFDSEKSKDYLYKCLLCTSCVEACPNDSGTDTIVEIARRRIVELHGLPLYKKVMAKILLNRNLMDLSALSANLLSVFLFNKNTNTSRQSNSLKIKLPFVDKDRLLPPLAPKTFYHKYESYGKNAKISIFPGCLINYTYVKIGDAFINILHKLNISYLIEKKASCCGAPIYFSGNFDDAKILAKRNIDLFYNQDIDYLVVLEPTCASMMKFDYPKLFMYFEDKEYTKKATEFAEKIIDPVKYLYDNTDIKDRLKDTGLTVTYHDPCHLKRTQKVKNEPRDLIKHAAKFKEMKEADRCCGNGGTFSIDYRDLSLKIASRKIDNILDSKAQALVTGCSACIMQLSEALHIAGHDEIKTLHTLELIDKSLGG